MSDGQILDLQHLIQARGWYAQGLRPVDSKRADFNAQIQRETATWARLIREAGVEAK